MRGGDLTSMPFHINGLRFSGKQLQLPPPNNKSQIGLLRPCMSTASSVSDSMIMQCQINHWVTNSLSFNYIDIKFYDICNLQWSGRRVCNVLQILTIIAESNFIICTKYWSCSCRWVIPIRTFFVTLWVTPGEPWGDSGSYHRPLLCIMNQSRTSAQLITDLSIVFNSAMFQNWSP